MSFISVRAFACRPTFWILTGTVMLPLNLLFAIFFWLRALILGAEGRARSARCLNVQLTYTLVFFLPFILAQLFSTSLLDRVFPGGAIRTAVAGISFGIIGLSGVIVLIFSNTRTFAGDLLGQDVAQPSRVKFVPES